MFWHNLVLTGECWWKSLQLGQQSSASPGRAAGAPATPAEIWVGSSRLFLVRCLLQNPSTSHSLRVCFFNLWDRSLNLWLPRKPDNPSWRWLFGWTDSVWDLVMRSSRLDFFFPLLSCDCNRAASPSAGCCQIAVWKHPCEKGEYFAVQTCSPPTGIMGTQGIAGLCPGAGGVLTRGYPVLGGAWLCTAVQAVVLSQEPGFGCLAPEGKWLSPAALPGLAGCQQSRVQWALPPILGCQLNPVPCCGACLPASLSQSKRIIIKHEI